jgi:hypothetical protein
MGLLYGRAGRLTAKNAGFWPGQAAQYDKVREAKGDTYYEKPMALTKFGLPDWRPGMDPVMHQNNTHIRFNL